MQYKQQYKHKINAKDQWETPQDLFDILHNVFSFTIDAAATKDNAKLKFYYDIDSDGLAQDWNGETVFCNPPHTDGAYAAWVDKAVEEFHEGLTETVMVLPFNSETRGFRSVWKFAHFLIQPYSRIRYEINGVSQGSPTFNSCIAVFRHQDFRTEELIELSEIGYVINLFEGLFPGYIL